MTSNKTKQLLHILKWQSLVISSQDNDEMGVMVQRRGIFYKFGFSRKDYVAALTFLSRLKTMWKASKNSENNKVFIFTVLPLLFLFSLTTS